MKFREIVLIYIFSLIMLLFLSSGGHAFDLANPLFHSGITKNGSSGLLITRGGTTIAEGTHFAGIYLNYFDRDISSSASEKKFTIPVTYTAGFPYNFELAGKITFASVDNSSSESGLADVGATVKWAFFKQEETKNLPSLATGISGSIALASGNKGLSEFQDYTITWFLSGTALIDLGPSRDYAFALFGEGDIVLNDLGKNIEDGYGAYKAGIILPIPGYTHMAFITELDGTVDRGFGQKGDFFRITPSYRVNLDRYSITAAIGYVFPEADAADSYFEYTLTGVIGF